MVDQREVRRLLGLHARADVLQARRAGRTHTVRNEIVATVCMESESFAVQVSIFCLFSVTMYNLKASFPPPKTHNMDPNFSQDSCCSSMSRH